MSSAYSLAQLRHQMITPLQEAWQARQVIRRYPAMKPVIAAYKKLYPYVGSTASVSVNERMQKRIEDDTLTYGETRWSSFLKLLDAIDISPRDRFVDLGCGAGFLCFLMAQAHGIEATGVDLIEGFVGNARSICEDLQLQQPRFQRADIFELEYLPFSIIYATCTCFPEDYMERLTEKLEHTRKGTRILTVTEPVQAPYLRQRKQLRLKYDWGMDTVYIAERK